MPYRERASDEGNAEALAVPRYGAPIMFRLVSGTTISETGSQLGGSMNRRTTARVFTAALALAALVFVAPASSAQQHDSTMAGMQHDSAHVNAQPMRDEFGPPKDFFKNMMSDMAQNAATMADVMMTTQL